MNYRVEIDQSRCDSYRICVLAAPEVFELDPNTNIAVVRSGHPVDADTDDLLDAETQCPARAIRLSQQ